MAAKVYNAWCNEQHEHDLLEGYGYCCQTPCLLAVYSIDKTKTDDECKFIRYECAICSKLLYVKTAVKAVEGLWI